jgi:cell division protein FtsN
MHAKCYEGWLAAGKQKGCTQCNGPISAYAPKLAEACVIVIESDEEPATMEPVSKKAKTAQRTAEEETAKDEAQEEAKNTKVEGREAVTAQRKNLIQTASSSIENTLNDIRPSSSTDAEPAQAEEEAAKKKQAAQLAKKKKQAEQAEQAKKKKAEGVALRYDRSEMRGNEFSVFSAGARLFLVVSYPL